MDEEKRRIYKLEVMGAIVTVDDEGDWKVIEKSEQIDEESVLLLLQWACMDPIWVPTFPDGVAYANCAINDMEGKLLEIDPPFSDEPLPEGTVY